MKTRTTTGGGRWSTECNSGSFLAFTLIELLVVISIMGILAALIVGVAGAAIKKGRLSMCEAQRDQLVTSIESYYAKKSVYPPDNVNNTTNNALFYELSGTTNMNDGTFRPLTGPPVQTNLMQTVLGIPGFINSCVKPAGQDADFQPPLAFLKGFRDSQKLTLTNSGNGDYTLLCVPLPNPYVVPVVPPSPWNYVSSHPTNNSTTFDLWVDIKIGSTIYRISNWNKEPQALN